MSTIASTGNSVLDALNGVTSTSSTSSTSSSTTDTTDATGTSSLGKDAFLQLLVTQMKNQNPLDPQDNTQFVSQLAQFSSLESMQNLNTSVDSILSSAQSSQALQASSLVGRSVTVATDSTVVDTSKSMTGSVVVPSSSSDTQVGVYDTAGDLVKTIDLGSTTAGTSSFTWDGTDEDGTVATAGEYTFKATGSIAGTSTALTTNLPATVNSVTLSSTGGSMMLNLAGGSSVALTSVLSVGI